MTRSLATRGWLLPMMWLALLTIPAFHGASAQTRPDNRAESTASTEDEGRDEASDSEEATEDSGQGSDRQSSTVTNAERKGKLVQANERNVSPLVAAAAASSAKRKSVRKFTDADLAGAKGKLIIVEGTNVREPEIIPIEERSPEVDSPPTNDYLEESREVRRQAEAKALRKEIADLEIEVRQLEDDYYLVEEEDHREVIERSFAEKRRSLAEKKKRLSELDSGGNP